MVFEVKIDFTFWVMIRMILIQTVILHLFWTM